MIRGAAAGSAAGDCRSARGLLLFFLVGRQGVDPKDEARPGVGFQKRALSRGRTVE